MEQAVGMRLELAGAEVELDRPRGASALLVLTHGAGGGVQTRDVLAVRAAATAAGIAVALLTQPYRVAGRRTPPAPGPQDAAWLDVIAALRKQRGLGRLPLFVGGRSNGARLAARTADRVGATGVVAMAYPLHPPGKPERSRLDELEAATCPVLVVQGDRDPFGMPPAGPARTVEVVPGADHALRKDLARIAELIVSFVTSTAAHDNV
jgi:predicted alpha/beta-hydrolase family hydrolase